MRILEQLAIQLQHLDVITSVLINVPFTKLHVTVELLQEMERNSVLYFPTKNTLRLMNFFWRSNNNMFFFTKKQVLCKNRYSERFTHKFHFEQKFKEKNENSFLQTTYPSFLLSSAYLHCPLDYKVVVPSCHNQ